MSSRGPRRTHPDIRPAGDRAFLLTPADPRLVDGLTHALTRHRIAGVRDVLPAAETVLVTLDPGARSEPVRAELDHLLRALVSRDFPVESPTADTEVVQIGVYYDGVDLPEVARQLDLTRDEVIAAHTGVVWRCAFVGFAPGFGYLTSDSDRLAGVRRRSEARTAIPAGSVALAGSYSAVYPRRSPGGWQLIGHTELPLWDPQRDPPALISQGTWVRFFELPGQGAGP